MKPIIKYLGIGIGVLGLAIAGTFSFQYHQAQKSTDELIANAEKLAEEAGSLAGNFASAQSDTSSEGNSSQANPADSSGNPTTAKPIGSNVLAGNAGETSSDQNSTPIVQVDYKKQMAATYNTTLAAMTAVRDNTYALKDQKMTVSQFKASIQQAKQQFTDAQNYVQSNPPQDPNLLTQYKEFLTGIILANQSMDVVMEGLKSLNPSSLYSAKDIGTIAKDKVVKAYSQF